MLPMSSRIDEIMDSDFYPQRPGEPACSYYIRTGLCRFGATCRFNHPPNRKLAIAALGLKGEFPERIGQPECQFYLKTGTCKFGATCRFHHPRDKAGIAASVSLNILGYPVRPDETECAYYLRTGQCKFGSTCKFHHPQPTNVMVSLHGSPVYPAALDQQSYAGGISDWSSASFVTSPRWQASSSYAPFILPQGVTSVPGWSSYRGQSSSDSRQQTRSSLLYGGTSRQGGLSDARSSGLFAPLGSGSVPVGFYAWQRGSVFPERPGQPECQFYMKTGDCKFGAVCKFHHPKDRPIPSPNCLLNHIGLPLRPDEPLCIFYSRYGICKFGPSCKFHHPMGGAFSQQMHASPLPPPPPPHGDENAT